MKKQKFHRGNLVHIKKIPKNSSMGHFQSDCNAIIIGSYYEQYGGGPNPEHEYTIMINGYKTSWYYESQLTLLDKGGEHLIKKAEKKVENKEKNYKDPKWIYTNLDEALKSDYSNLAIQTLGELTGFTNWYGSHGEYYIYIENIFQAIVMISFAISKTKNYKEFYSFMSNIKKNKEKLIKES